MAYEIWAFNNVDEVRTVLQAVVAMMGAPDFLGAMKTFAIASMLVMAGAVMLMMQRADGIGQWLLMLAFFYYGLFVPRVDVLIQDRTGIQASSTVGQVPLGIAFFASSTSKIGSWLTQQTETVFSLPNDLKFQKNGMMFGAKMVQDARAAAVDDPIFRADLINYVRNCVNPDILDGYKDPTVLRNSIDLWTDLDDTNPGRWTTVNGGADVKNCLEAYADLTPKWTAQVDKQTTLLGRSTNSWQTNPVAAKALVQSQLPDAFSTMLAMSQTASDIIKQNMMLNMMNDAAITIPQLMGDPVAAQVALAKAQADAQAVTQYRTLAKIAEETLPKVRNVVELLIIGLFPFMFLLMIVTGVKGFALLKNYAFMLIFVQLWAPLYAILNYIGTTGAASKTQAAMQGIGGLALANADGIAAATLNQQHIVGMMTMAIPVIAWGIAKLGEMSMGSIAGNLMSPLSSSGGAAAAGAGAGNLNLGNSSLDTNKANLSNQNKWERDVAMTFGATKQRQLNGGSWTTYGDGTATYDAPANNTGALSANIAQNAQRALTASAETLTSAGKSNTTAGQKLQTSALTDVVSNAASKVNTNELSKTQTREQTNRFAQGKLATESLISQVQRASGLSQTDAANAVVSASLGFKIGSTGMSGTYSDQTLRNVQNALSSASSEQVNQTREYVNSLSNSQAHRNAIATSSSQSQQSTAQLAKSQQLSETGQAQLQEAATRREQASSSSMGSWGAALDVLKLPGNSGLLAGLDKEVRGHMQANRPDAALQAIADRAAFIGFSTPPAPKAPPALPAEMASGAATPTQHSLQEDFARDSSAVKGSVNPSDQFNGDRTQSGIKEGQAPGHAVQGSPASSVSSGDVGSGQTYKSSGPKARSGGNRIVNPNANSWRSQPRAANSNGSPDSTLTKEFDEMGQSNRSRRTQAEKDIGAHAGADGQLVTTRSNRNSVIDRSTKDLVEGTNRIGEGAKPRYDPNQNPAAKEPDAKTGILGGVFVPHKN